MYTLLKRLHSQFTCMHTVWMSYVQIKLQNPLPIVGDKGYKTDKTKNAKQEQRISILGMHPLTIGWWILEADTFLSSCSIFKLWEKHPYLKPGSLCNKQSPKGKTMCKCLKYILWRQHRKCPGLITSKDDTLGGTQYYVVKFRMIYNR